MRKMLLIFLLLLSQHATPIEAKAETETIAQNQRPSVMELAFLRSLGNTILEVMNTNGDKQLFTYGRIEKISRNINTDTYDITLRVIGFEGPHNPPYKFIRMTIRIPGEKDNKYTVISYEHRIISDKELKELIKFVD